MQEQELEYAGFWIRTVASLIDSIIIMLIIYPLLILIYGWDYFYLSQASLIAGPADLLITWILPAVAVVIFWMQKQATPGKIAVGARVVDATTGETLTAGQSIGRYLAYFVSMIPLGLGLIWVAIDSKKQGWHDKLAGTVVIRSKKHAPEPVKFDRA